MKVLRTAVIAATVLCSMSIISRPAGAEIWTFRGLGDLAGGRFQSAGYDVSDDGSVVVGSGWTDVDNKAFYWTQSGGMIQIEGSPYYSHASAVSADGTVASGWVWNRATAHVEAFRWTKATGHVMLGDLAGGTTESYANDISQDGSVIVGLGHTEAGYQAMRWSSTGGMVGLGDLPGGAFNSGATGVSGDGSVVVGVASSNLGREAFRWTAAAGMKGLGDLEGGTFESYAESVLDNGNMVIGYGNSASGREAFRWRQDTGMVGLGDLSGGVFWSEAWSGTADGSIIVGAGSTENGLEAFIWDASRGMRSLQSVLANEYGADLSGWRLSYALSMSPDGKTIVGSGINPQGNLEGWIAFETEAVPEPSLIVLLLGLGLMGLAHKRAWGPRMSATAVGIFSGHRRN